MPKAFLLLAAIALLAAGEDEPAPVRVGPSVDPAVLAPLAAAEVPWEEGERILLVGDLLCAPGQPEPALRIHEALAAARPALGIAVHSLMNHAIPIERWRDAAKQEIARRPPTLVVVCAGLGDIAAAQTAKAAPPAASAWRAALAEIVASAQAAGAAVVVATPAVYGDKPADGFGFKDLDGYAEAARSVATESKAVLCDLRRPMLELLAAKNPKGNRETGVLSKTPGQLRPEAMDLATGLLATAMATAAGRIPWRIEVPDATFKAPGKGVAELRLRHIAPAQVAIRHTVDGTAPTDASPAWTGALTVERTTELRVLAVAKDGSRRTATGWIMATRPHAAVNDPPETLPGVWVDHVSFPAWVDPSPPIDTLPADFATWWPNCETAVVKTIPNHRYSETNFGLRFSGFFLAPVDGIYVFATASDDSARLVVDGERLIDCGGLHAAKRSQGAIDLNRGLHPFTLSYGQGPGPYALNVEVAMPGQRFNRLSDQLLRRPAVRPVPKDAPTTAKAEPAAAKTDPAVLAPLADPAVAWEAGDRVLLVGDLLGAPGQVELALRIHEALAAARPDLGLVVHSLMNHGYTTAQWRDAAKAEIAKRPPALVVVMAGLGDVLAAQAAKTAPAAPDAYRAALAEILADAKAARAAVVVATPAICGDRPSGGPGAAELDGYAEAARKAAADAKAELCDLRKALLAALSERNPKGAETGVLSQAPGRLLPAGMDLVAGLVARAMAAAVPRIPWSVQVPDAVFTEGGKAEVRIRHGTAAQLDIYATTDGREPTEKSPAYSKPIGVGATTWLRVLAVAREGGARQTAGGWIMKTGRSEAERPAPESIPGLWVDHYTFKQWRDPIPPLDGMRPDFETAWPNTELAVLGLVPNQRWPEVNFGLRFIGYFLAPVDGTYVFSTNSDDCTRLAVGRSMLVKNDDLHPARAEQAAIELTRGLHPLSLLYGQGPGVTLCDVQVGLVGQRLQPLPDLLLRRPPVKPPKKALTAEIGGD